MQINTLSAYQTTAEEFFDKIAEWKADLVLDVRLKNTNQLSGFTKQEDLEYFCRVIAHADYFAAYEKELEERDAIPAFFKKYGTYDSVAIVGTATKKRHSHAEELKILLDRYQAKG